MQSGSVVADSVGLVTIPGVQILTGRGSRLVLTRISTAPVLAPIGTTQLQAPTFTWSASPGAASYDLWISNLTTGQSPVIQTNVSTTSYTPTIPLGIGRYRIWVRSKTSTGNLSTWSTAIDFQINTPAVIDSPGSVFFDAIGLTWIALPGAVKYDLWINNVTTGQSQVIRATALTTNSFQVASLPLGNYRAWVRGIDAGNVGALWSGSVEFTAAPRAVLTSPATPGFNNRPTFQWQALAGATTYQTTFGIRPRTLLL